MKKFLLSIFAVLFAFAGAQAQTWTKVTDASTLKAGDKVVIVAKDYNFAMSTKQNNNNRGQQAVTKSGNEVSWVSGVQEFELKSGTKSGSFAFYTGSGYLYAASSSSNYLRTETTLTANSSWAITIAADGTATVKAQGTYTHNVMQYNPSSSLFACYSSASQKAICIYKKTEAGGNVAKVELPQISVANNSTIEVGAEITITPAADNSVYYTINGGNRVVIGTNSATITAGQAGTMTLAITTVCGDETLNATYNYTVKPVKPSINADATSFEDELEVEINADGDVYYTLDGTEPKIGSTLYEEPFTITETITVKAIAVSNGVASDVASATYTKIEPVTPPAEGVSVIVFNKKDPDATNALSVDKFVSDGIASTDFESLSCTATEKCYVGVNGIKMSSSSANGTFTLNLGANYNVKTITVNAVKWGSDDAKLTVNGATERDLTDSATDYVFDVNSTINQIKVDMTRRGYVAKIMVELNTSAEVVVIDAPTLTAGATFNETATVEITNNAEGTTLYYSYDDVNYEEYIGALTITETTTVYAYAKDDDGNQSAKVSETYTIIKSSVGYYVKVTSEPADWSGKYLVVYEEEADAYVFNGEDETNGYVAATIDGGVIKANGKLDAVAVTIAVMEGGYSVKTANGYIYGASTSNKLNTNASEPQLNTIEFTADGVNIEAGRYLRFNSAKGDMRFRYYNLTYGESVQLYKYVTELPSYQLSVTDAGYATLFLDFPATIPAFEGEDAGAYIVKADGVNNGYVTLTQVTGVLPAETGVIVKATKGDYTFAYSADKAADVAGNLLEGSVTGKNVEGEAYVLGYAEGTTDVVFGKAKMNGTSWWNNANKAYLPVSALSAGSDAPYYSFRFGEGTTGIDEITDNREQSTVIYDLTGRRVEEITAPGIYIINGKKVLVK